MTQIYLTRRQVAELYPIAEDTLARLAHQNRGPMFYKPFDKALYKPADIEKWIESAPALQGDGQASANKGQRGKNKTPRAERLTPPVKAVVADGVRARRLKSLPPSSHSSLNAK